MNIRSRLKEYARFGLVGVLNTATDFVVLNILISFLPAYIIAKTLSFSVAVVQSYFLNRYWVFRVGGGKNMEETARFLTVSLAGLLVNIAAAALVFASLPPALVPDVRLRANIGAVVGTLVVLAWNYTGYKFFVFKTASKTP